MPQTKLTKSSDFNSWTKKYHNDLFYMYKYFVTINITYYQFLVAAYCCSRDKISLNPGPTWM